MAVLLGGGAIPIAATEIKKRPTLADRPFASLSSWKKPSSTNIKS
jgi:hypothetical protein